MATKISFSVIFRSNLYTSKVQHGSAIIFVKCSVTRSSLFHSDKGGEEKFTVVDLSSPQQSAFACITNSTQENGQINALRLHRGRAKLRARTLIFGDMP